jgi:hypothetical protein
MDPVDPKMAIRFFKIQRSVVKLIFIAGRTANLPAAVGFDVEPRLSLRDFDIVLWKTVEKIDDPLNS